MGYLNVIIACFILVISSAKAASEETSFEDVRCRCVCPKLNDTIQDRTVYISANVNPNMCTCVEVVKDASSKLCPQCECKYESRNTTTIKVVVIFTICVVSLLFVYMVFLFLLDHLVSWRPSSYQQHVSEEDEHSVTSTAPVVSRPDLTRQRSIINRVSDEQKRWKGTVQEQRKNIYDRHSMLN